MRRSAEAISGAVSLEARPPGSPRFRNVIRVPPSGPSLPRVSRLDGERPFVGLHHEPLQRDELGHPVGVREPSTEKRTDEDEVRPDTEPLLRLPLDALDVLVPLGGVARVRRIHGDDGTRPRDLDLGLDVDRQS